METKKLFEIHITNVEIIKNKKQYLSFAMGLYFFK